MVWSPGRAGRVSTTPTVPIFFVINRAAVIFFPKFAGGAISIRHSGRSFFSRDQNCTRKYQRSRPNRRGGFFPSVRGVPGLPGSTLRWAVLRGVTG